MQVWRLDFFAVPGSKFEVSKLGGLKLYMMCIYTCTYMWVHISLFQLETNRAKVGPEKKPTLTPEHCFLKWHMAKPFRSTEICFGTSKSRSTCCYLASLWRYVPFNAKEKFKSFGQQSRPILCQPGKPCAAVHRNFLAALGLP